MDGRILSGAFFAIGAIAFFSWGAYKAILKTRETPEKEVFDALKAGATIIPGIAGAFLAGYALPTTGGFQLVALLTSGWGFSSMMHEGDKALGVSNFFS